MRDHLTPACSGAKLLLRLILPSVPIILLLLLSACGGGTAHPNVFLSGPPSISSLSPTTGVAGTSVTIAGSNFGTIPSSVTFNGTTASIAGWNDSSIVAKVPSGATTGSVIVTVNGTASNGVTFTVVVLSAGAIAPSNFGMQCGIGDTSDCGNAAASLVVWPTTQAQPGTLRLHDTGTQWANIEGGGAGVYQWNNLDAWLDAIAAHQPLDVIEVFTWVPCWDIPSGAVCSSPPTSPVGTNVPPADLTSSGSPSFNAFVTAFVQHCSPNNNCVKDNIKYYEMWNEWDLQYHWTGTMAQVYQMVAPAAGIIKSNITGAFILTPSSTPDSDTGIGYQADLQNWLNYETSHGVISDWIAWHSYLTAPQNNQTQIVTPETQWGAVNVNFLSIQASTPGWTTTPWADTETNYNGSPPPGLNYTCPSSSSPNPPVTFSADDCAGMIARWQLLHASNGAVSVDWYKWNETIGGNPQYETVYYNLMQDLVGGTFNGPCHFLGANGATTWTCSFTEENSTQALWVWTPNEAGTTYNVPAGYVDYLDLQGNTNPVTAGQTIQITVQPFLLEQ
jgi:hypothetical protein